MTLALLIGVPAQAGTALVKTRQHAVSTLKQADRQLENTPRHFRKGVVKSTKRATKGMCLPGEGRAALRVSWYHRKGFALGSVEACTVGYSVVWKKKRRGWREALVYQAIPSCTELRRIKVPVKLWAKAGGWCAADGSGDPYVRYV